MSAPIGEDYATELLNETVFLNPLDVMLGQWRLVSDSGKRVRSNYWAMGGWDTVADSALASTGVAAFCPITVWPGDIITNVWILTGNTAGSTLTHAWAALYVGGIALPTVIAQSTDSTAATTAASTWTKFALSAATTITAAMAPYGYIYAAISYTGTPPTAAAYSIPTVLQPAAPAVATAPIFQSFTAGSALGATAVTVASPAAKAVQVLTVLS